MQQFLLPLSYVDDMVLKVFCQSTGLTIIVVKTKVWYWGLCNVMSSIPHLYVIENPHNFNKDKNILALMHLPQINGEHVLSLRFKLVRQVIICERIIATK